MVRYKQPISPGSSATDVVYTYCHVIGLDLTNKIAHVIDQLGNPKAVSITRSMGKLIAYPAIGEDWIITRDYGDWMFAVNISASLSPIGQAPAGGNQGAVLTKQTAADFDLAWVDSSILPTASTNVIRDASGRTQVSTPVSTNDVVNKQYADSLVPSGIVYPYAGAVSPAGFLMCQGQAVSRTVYSNLFAVIGTAYGGGDGSTTFNVPNLQGNAPTGLKTGDANFGALGASGGATTHSHTSASHSHTLSGAGQAQITGSASATIEYGRVNSGTWTPLIRTTGTNGTPSATNTTAVPLMGTTDVTAPAATGSSSSLSPFLVLNFIIKT